MKNSKFLSLFLVAMMVVTMAVPSYAGTTLGGSDLNLTKTITYKEPVGKVKVIVELETEPLLKKAIEAGVSLQSLDASTLNSAMASIEKEQVNVQNDMMAINDEITFKYSYTKAYNGLSAEVDYSDIDSIKALPNVKAVHIAKKYSLPEPDMNTSNGMVFSPQTWDIGYDGEGMVVAVIDSGIDYEHPDLVLSDDASAKLELTDINSILSTKDLAAEGFALEAEVPFTLAGSDVYKSAKVPFAFDYADEDTIAKADTSKPEGSMHGMHVSGTVAANGSIKGVAPEAQILGLKVFSDEDKYAYDDDIVAAIDDAVALGADVINMSLGATAGFTTYSDPEQVAIKNAKEAGLVVAVSAGNSNRFGDSYDEPYSFNPDTAMVGSPSAGLGTLSVASVENIMAQMAYILATDGTKMQYQPTDGPDPIELFTSPVAYEYCGLGGTTADFDGLDLTGKIALIQRGAYNFTDKIMNAQIAGAAGVIVFNDAARGDELVSMQYPAEGTIPALFIGHAHGEKLVNLATTIEFDTSFVDAFPNLGAGEMSDFTSWGPTPTLVLKPEITAPGGDIYSLLNDGKYGSMSGTSMASPHVAGGSALVLQYVDDAFGYTGYERSQFAKALLMSTASPIKDPDEIEYSPRRQGAGLMDLYNAVTTDVVVYNNLSDKESKVELKEINSSTVTFDVTVDNFGDVEHDFIVDVSALTDGCYDYQGAPYYNDGNPRPIEAAVVTVENSRLEAYNMTTSGVLTVASVDPSMVDVNNGNFIRNEEKVNVTTDATIVVLPVAANSRETVTVSVDISDYLDNVWPDLWTFNGFFVEGFVKFYQLDESDSQGDVSVPYMGFYGGWESAPILDGDIYDPSAFSYFETQGMLSTYETIDGVNGDYLGYNAITEEASYGWISISPDGDDFYDNAALLPSFLRNADYVNVRIENSVNRPVKYVSLNDMFNLRKQIVDGGEPPYTFPAGEYEGFVWDGQFNDVAAPEGQYYYVVEAHIGNASNPAQLYYYPVFVDLSAPYWTQKTIDGNSLVLEAEDSVGVQYYGIKGVSEDAFTLSVDGEFDITNYSDETIDAIIVDYAGNVREIPDVINATPETLEGNVDNIIDGNTRFVYGEVSPDDLKDDSDNSSGGGGGGGAAPAPSPEPDTPEEKIENASKIDPAKVKVVVTETSAEVKLESADVINAVDLAQQAIKDAGKTDKPVIEIEIPASAKAKKEVSIDIPNDAMAKLSAAGASLKIKGETVEFKLAPDFADLDGKDLKVEMKSDVEVEYTLASGYKAIGIAYDFDIKAGDSKVTRFNTKPEITLTIPEGTDKPETLGVYVQDEEGTWEYVQGFFDAELNTLRFKAPHFSVYALMQYEKTFDDIQSHWAKANIELMASKHVVSGVGENLFAPDASVTRAEFVTMALNAIGETDGGIGTFNDVNSGEWYAPYLAKAKDLELIGADANGNFRPLELITREEMAVIIAKAHMLINNIEVVDTYPSVTFGDKGTISANASSYVGYVQNEGIISGYSDHTFRPKANATRAEAATMIKLMLDK